MPDQRDRDEEDDETKAALRGGIPTRRPPSRRLSSFWKRYENARNLVAFFCFGLANNFGYVIMLSAAFDLLAKFDDFDSAARIKDEKKLFQRECNVLSTGAILLADIIPSFVAKIVTPFIPLCIHVRMIVVVLTSSLGLILVAVAENKETILAGVAFVSLSSGLGESTLIAYTVHFGSKHVISTWASGTGAAGVLGSFVYSALLQIGLTSKTAILCMLLMPFLMAVCFWFVLGSPSTQETVPTLVDGRRSLKDQFPQEESLKQVDQSAPDTFKAKAALAPHILMTYTSWFGLVYFFEYFINHALYELTYIPKSFLSHKDQYRWYFTLYQVGVFISRSSVSIAPIQRTWIQALFQGFNLFLFLFEAIYGYMTYLSIPLILCLWEGLMGGSSYVNTFRRIAVEMPANQREFAMALNAIGDSVMITLSGFISQPVHDAICKTPQPYT